MPFCKCVNMVARASFAAHAGGWTRSSARFEVIEILAWPVGCTGEGAVVSARRLIAILKRGACRRLRQGHSPRCLSPGAAAANVAELFRCGSRRCYVSSLSLQ